MPLCRAGRGTCVVPPGWHWPPLQLPCLPQPLVPLATQPIPCHRRYSRRSLATALPRRPQPRRASCRSCFLPAAHADHTIESPPNTLSMVAGASAAIASNPMYPQTITSVGAVDIVEINATTTYAIAGTVVGDVHSIRVFSNGTLSPVDMIEQPAGSAEGISAIDTFVLNETAYAITASPANKTMVIRIDGKRHARQCQHGDRRDWRI